MNWELTQMFLALVVIQKKCQAFQNSWTRVDGEPVSSLHSVDKVLGHSTSIQLKYQSHRNDAQPEGQVSRVRSEPEPKAL